MRESFFVSLLLLMLFSSCNDSIPISANLSKELTMVKAQDKIWAHRVDFLDGIEKRVYEFEGVEVDIFYNPKDDKFDVKHDLDAPGIDLEVFLDSIQKVKDVFFWFDYKNLNEETSSGVSALNTILYARGLEKKSFVESFYIHELESFDGRLATSFWVSATTIPENKEDRDKLYQESYSAIKGYNVSMLSASYEMYEFLLEYFPNRKCNFWMSGSLTEENISTLRKMVELPNVNVILIDGNKNLLR